MPKQSTQRPGDMDDQDFPQPPDPGMDEFPLPPGHGDDFDHMPVPDSRAGALAGKGRAPAVETFPEGDDDDETPSRPLRRRHEPEPEDNYAFGQDEPQDAFAEGPEHHLDDDGHGFGSHGVGEPAFDGEADGAFDPDPDAAPSDDDHAAPAGAAVAKDAANRSKLITWGAAGAMVLFTGFFGWKYVSSVFGLDAAPPAQVANVSPMGGMPQPKWATSSQGMGMPQGMGAPGQRMPPMGQQQVSMPAAPGMPAMPQGINMKAPSTVPTPSPLAGPAPAQAAPALPGLSEASPMAASSMPPAAMMGGARDARPAGGGDAALLDRIDRLERRIAELSDRPAQAPDGDRLASLEQRVQGVEARAVAPTTPRPSIMPPTKPPVIPGWSLKGVQNGVAWLNGPNGFVEARVGTDLQGAGHVKSVARYDQDWVVMTDNGVILRK